MYCSICGAEASAAANFCSACGKNLVADGSVPVPRRDWDLHVNVLGWVMVAHAALTGLIGLIVMFGGHLIHSFILENPGIFANANPNDVPPPEAIALISPVAFLIGVIFLVFSVPSVAAGIGLLRFRTWGRVLTLILSFLRILEFPFGTATSIYAFWILLSKSGKSYYKERSAQAEA